MSETPTRPVLRWHGGKWRLAPWIIGHFPKHRTYVEPFGGAASVLLRNDDMLAGWRRVEMDTYADGARPRTEVLWINPACADALDASKAQLNFLDGAA